MIDIDHYDLLKRDEWRANSVLVVSPYVEENFFKRILRQLKPKVLTVVIDDGCRAEDLLMIQQLPKTGTSIKVALGSASGLVHAKIFHIEWLTPGGQRRNTLVYGSGNATRQAFEGNINSELMCRVELTSKQHAPILEWTTAVRSAVSDGVSAREIMPVRDARLGNGITIRLPGLKVKEAGSKASNLDLWLQRGHLLANFQRDPSFLRVHVHLLNELPPGEDARRIEAIGFDAPKTRRLPFAYVQSDKYSELSGDGPGNWRSKYFVWTQLGYWCSDSCFRMRRHLFRAFGHEIRYQEIETLKSLKEKSKKLLACKNFLQGVHRLWDVFGTEASNYLESSHDLLNEDFYLDTFERKVERDLELADDEEFVARYINGCEIINVPRFRPDNAAWKDFVESFSRQLHLEFLKNPSKSLIFKCIYDAVAEFDEFVFDDPKKLVKLLREKWNHKIEGDDGEEVTVGEYIASYPD